jgi:hypothetical protein
MNSTPAPNGVEPRDAQVARADERLANAHEQIKRADEDLARLSEQLAKIERDAAPPASAVPGQQLLRGRPARQVLVGLSLAACFIVAALVWQSSYGGGTKLVVALSEPQATSTPSLPPEDPPIPAQPASSSIQLAAAETATAQATPSPATPAAQTTTAQSTTAQTITAQTATQDAAPTATAAPPDQAQLLQKVARDLANLERSIEQLKANQQQLASDNSKAIEQLKASQEEMKRALAKVSEPNLSRASAAPAPPAPAVRRPERTSRSSKPRPRYRYPREWIYDEW